MNDPRFDEQLPWLQAVENEDEPRGISAGRMLTGLLLVGLIAAIVAGTFFWLGRRDLADSGPPELIKAPATPYKIKPADPGGLDITGESETAFETSAGEDHDSQLDLNALPETPVAKAATPPQPAATAPQASPAPSPEGQAGSIIQLGAFQNQAQAERAWTALSARFAAIAGMNKMLVPFAGGVRLRAAAASSGEARAICQTLRAAGENCFVAP